jgi:hypothetical protein
MNIPKQYRLLFVSVAVLTGVVLPATMLAWSAYAKSQWVPRLHWLGFAAFTVITFAAVFVEFRQYWHTRLFWRNVSIAFASHATAYSVVLANVLTWPILLFAVICVLEIQLINVIIYRSLARTGNASGTQ